MISEDVGECVFFLGLIVMALVAIGKIIVKEVSLSREKEIASLEQKVSRLDEREVDLKHQLTSARYSAEVKEKDKADLQERITRAIGILDPDEKEGEKQGGDEAKKASAPSPPANHYACSVQSLNNEGGAHHWACLVSAVSRDEAYGKVARIAKKQFPDKDGFDKPTIIVTKYVADPDTFVPAGKS